jgi:hypothetical protein
VKGQRVRVNLATRCVRRKRRNDLELWARDLVRRPQCYGVDEHIRRIVSELLTEVCR